MQDDDWNYNQPVDGDEKVCMCLVDNDLADGQLAYAAGGIPSKPHEWMVSNLLSPYSSRVLESEDNKATEQKPEQTAPASSPGLVHHPKMGAESYTLLSVLNRRQTATQAPLDLLPSTLLLPRFGGSGLAARTPQLLTTAVDV